MQTAYFTQGTRKRYCLLYNLKINKTFDIFIQAKSVMEEANEINKIIPGTENYYYKKYFLPKYLGVKNCSIK